MRSRKAYLLLTVLILAFCACGEKQLDTKQPVSSAVSTPTPTVLSEQTPVPVSSPIHTPQEISLSVFTPTPTPSPVPTPSPTPVPFWGEWKFNFEGQDILLLLDSGNSGKIIYAGKEQPFTWEYAAGKLTLKGVNNIFSVAYNGDSLTVDTGDGTLTFMGKEQS